MEIMYLIVGIVIGFVICFDLFLIIMETGSHRKEPKDKNDWRMP